jgi:outer membrane protein OmpA-like peptidoglycan-associated protein
MGVAALIVLGGAAVPALRAAEPSPSVGVTVDWQALDALPPGSASGPRTVDLHPPPQPARAAAPAVARSAPPPVAAPALPSVATAAPMLPPPTPRTAAEAVVAPALAPGRIGTVAFPKGQIDVPPNEAGLLDSLALKLAGDARARLQLVGYASGNADDALAARRISLARAVQLRAYLIQKGVPSVRMDVRALGDRNAGDGPADRVDLLIVEH